MANDLINGEGAGKPAPVAGDTSVWMYKGHDAKLFASSSAVPDGEGWQDAPYNVEAAPVKKAKAKKVEAEEVAPDGDSNGN